MKFTEIQISGLREGIHSFRFSLDSRFSEAFSADFFSQPNLNADIRLTTSETMLKAEVSISGDVELICDRSLEPFRQHVEERVLHFFKYGEEEQELSDELDVISPERVSLDFDQLIYDTVALSIPQKKIHPKLREEEGSEDGGSDGRLVYSSANSSEQEKEERDARWDILKNLN